MVVAILFCFNHIYQQYGQIKSVSRSADLVADYPELIVGFSKIQHGLNEVFAVLAEYPGNTDNEIFFQVFGNCQFSGQLGLSIHIKRLVILAVRLPGLSALAVEDVVGADVNHLTAQVFAHQGNISGAVGIDFPDSFFFIFIFCQVYGSPGSAVYHYVRIYFF